jgi:hypothetical protein
VELLRKAKNIRITGVFAEDGSEYVLNAGQAQN